MYTSLGHRRVLALLLLPITLLTVVTLVHHSLPPKTSTNQALWPRLRVRGQSRVQKQGISCQKTPETSVTIVVARSTEDTSWLDVYLGRIRHLVYQVIDANAEHTTTVNKGKEAMPYLQYIIDQYDQLPDVSVFSHGAMSAWHLVDKVRIIRSLQWGRHGYANLRHARMVCPEVWQCQHLGLDWRWSGLWLHPTDWQNVTRLKEPEGALHGILEDEFTDSWLIARNWDNAFLGALGPMPRTMHSPCCAEFLVSRERIQARPRAFYAHIRDWVQTSNESSFDTARFLEHTWAMIFGENAITLPIAECDLIDCTLDGGQVHVHSYGEHS